MLKQFESLFDLMEAIPDEQSAIDHFRAIRWKNGASCPHCGSTRVYHFSDKKNHKCGDCKKRFSIKVGTIFEDSKIGLRKWFMAIWLITSHKKGIASTQLAKDIKVTQKTAWFMLHRLRHASRTPSFKRQLSGEVEVDETRIGGKGHNMHAKDRKAGKPRKNKTIVVGMKERGGELRTQAVGRQFAAAAQHLIYKHIEPGSSLMTDEFPAYRIFRRSHNHLPVNHSAGEYKRGNAYTNSIESVWALLKRQILGIHHWVSAKHLQRYLDEMTFRQNSRQVEEGQRVNLLLDWTSGRRLTYKELIA